jgi:hypothetical protein
MALSHLSREIHRWQMDKEYRVKINTEFPAKSSTSQYLYYPRSSLPIASLHIADSLRVREANTQLTAVAASLLACPRPQPFLC